MTSRAEVRSDDSVHLEKRCACQPDLNRRMRLISFTRRLMRVLRPVVQITMLSMSHAGHHHSFCCPVAAELISNNDARLGSCAPQQLAKKPHRGKPVPLRLHKDIQDDTILIDRSPQVMSDTVDLQEDLVQMPFITGPGTPSSKAIDILLAELVAPAPDRLVAEHHSTSRHHLFNIAKAHSEGEVEPDGMRDDLSRKRMATVQSVQHSSSIPSRLRRPT